VQEEKLMPGRAQFVPTNEANFDLPSAGWAVPR